jgi:hypothetical protein
MQQNSRSPWNESHCSFYTSYKPLVKTLDINMIKDDKPTNTAATAANRRQSIVKKKKSVYQEFISTLQTSK